MNIHQNETRRPAEQSAGRRDNLYQTLPNWRELLAAVRAGEAEFVDALAELGLLQRYGKATSSVHPYDDIEGHAMILGIPSETRWYEVQTKSYLTYASHWIDDFFDSVELYPDTAQLMRDRREIRRALANMGAPGQVGFAMANRTAHPEAVYQALHRMLYGGLVQRSRDPEERRILMREYGVIATRLVAPELRAAIRALQPEAYWATNKTVLELLHAAEVEVDFTVAELWNLVYAPALFYQDADREHALGELSFASDEMPQPMEMLRMIRLGGEYLKRVHSIESPQFRQLRFLVSLFRGLPAGVVSEYRAIWEHRGDRDRFEVSRIQP